MKRKKEVFFYISLIVLIQNYCHYSQQISTSPIYRNWEIISESDYVLHAKMNILTDKEKKKISKRFKKDADIKFQIIEIIKGVSKDSIFYCQKLSLSPTPKSSSKYLENLNNKEVIVFLVDQDNKYSKKIFFTGSLSNSIIAYKDEQKENIKREINNQSTIINKYPELSVNLSDTMHQRVFKEIKRMRNPDEEFDAFKVLESYGKAAVPSIIRQMENWEELPIKQISLDNKNYNSFEAIRHYSPELVVDALAAILNQITLQGYGFIMNGATNREREKCIDGWKLYLFYKYKN